MFFVFGIFIAIFLEALLLAKKNKSRTDKVLAIWLFLIIANQTFNYFLFSGEMYQYPHWLGVDFPLPVVIGVFLYFYVREITGNSLKNVGIILLHLLPTLSLVLLAIPFYGLTGAEKVYVFENEGAGFEWYVTFSSILIPLSGLVYALWSLWLIKKHQLRIQHNFSNTDRKELQWLKYLSIGFVIIWIVSIFFDSTIIYSAVVVLVLFIGFFGISQLNIFYAPVVEISENLDATIGKSDGVQAPRTRTITKRYAKSGLNIEMAGEIYRKLTDFMNDGTLYKNENLTLSELAKRLGVHPNHLSQVINEQEGKNFYNYINAIRIKEFIRLASLPENKKYTMISLAYDVGFSSKSTFNKHFKSYTGTTPTVFFNE